MSNSRRQPTASLLMVLLLTSVVLCSSCLPEGFKEKANKQFGDQHFKTAIALIELHKVRNGVYPPNLDSLSFLGDWDRMIFNSVRYERLDSGYALDLTNGWMGTPEKLDFPEGFWKGLGLRKSNLKPASTGKQPE